MSPEQMAALLSSGKYSDFTIECQGQSFKVHTAIVCPQSSVIDAALHGEFEEARTRTVKIDGFDAETVQRMLDFMYGVQNLEEPIDATSDDGSDGDTEPIPEDVVSASCEEQKCKEQKKRLLSHVWTNAIADYYNVTGLCELANKEIALCFQTLWSPIAFLETADVVLSATGNKELHHLFARLAVEHVEELVDHGTKLTGLVALGDFAVQFMKGSAAKMSQWKETVSLYSKLEYNARSEALRFKSAIQKRHVELFDE